AGFNPRARVGRDQWDAVRDTVYKVSIHAPAWGATWFVDVFCAGFGCFNPRARVGRDPTLDLSWFASTLFQSTRPRGARHFSVDFYWDIGVFQSTRPRGARLVWLVPLIGAAGFNPRARVGRDLIRLLLG